MTPEEYLRRLVSETPGGWLATSPHSELRRSVDLFVRAIVAHNHGLKVEDAPGYAPECGPDGFLMALRDKLIPHFPAAHREALYNAPVGITYCADLNGFAARVPDEPGAVVCVDLHLKQLLATNNLCLHGFDPDQISRAGAEKSVYAYAAAQVLQLIHGLLGISLPTSVPKLHRNQNDVFTQSFVANTIQMAFILAHEYAHIVLGHVYRTAPERVNMVVKADELEADELAARVFLSYESAQQSSLTRDEIERHLGLVYAVFAASEAILDVRHMGKPYLRVYPDAANRFDQVIEVFRSKHGPDLMAAGPYVRPFELISIVYRLIPKDPLDAVGWLSEIAMECQKLGERGDERFILTVARTVAEMGGASTVARKIDAYLGNLP